MFTPESMAGLEAKIFGRLPVGVRLNEFGVGEHGSGPLPSWCIKLAAGGEGL